jgi:V/A-type H+-transporting ATPase subunit D
MARTSLSKSALSAQVRDLKTYERFLPSLDLKRKQLLAERNKGQAAEQALLGRVEVLRQQVAESLPMLADQGVRVDDMAVLRGVTLGRENLLGTTLPRLDGVDIETRPYGYLSQPHWVDVLVRRLHQMIALRVELAVQRRRNQLLAIAVRKITQRVNLFEKVLIPRSRDKIRRIRIHLADAERAAVVRSKIAKAKRARGGLA